MNAKMFVIYKNPQINTNLLLRDSDYIQERKKDPHISKADIVKKQLIFGRKKTSLRIMESWSNI